MRTLFFFVILAVVLCLPICGCTGTPSPPQPPVDIELKDFTLPSLTGKTITLSTFKGHPILLIFFTPHCSYCKKEVPFINEVYEKYKEQGLVVIGLGYGTEKEIRDFASKNGAKYPIVFFQDKKIANNYGVYAVPHHVFFNRRGAITRSVAGALPKRIFETFLKEIME